MAMNDLTIPREPGGGTGTMASCDTNCIKAFLKRRESLVITCGKRLQENTLKLMLSKQCRYTLQGTINVGNEKQLRLTA